MATSVTLVKAVEGKGLSTNDYTTEEKDKLAGVAAGATANSADSTLMSRANHTGTQAASTISDFSATARAQVEAMLVAGDNVTLTPSGTGASRQITVVATGGGGSGESVKFTREQEAHGLEAGRVVQSGASGFEYAQADSAANVQRILGVIESVTTDAMVVVSSGAIDVTGWGLTANTTYFLSAASAGVLTDTPPSGETEYYVEVLRVDSDGNAFVTLGEPVALAKIPASDLAITQVGTVEITAGTETAPRLWSPADVVAAIDEHAPEGGGESGEPTGTLVFSAGAPDTDHTGHPVFTAGGPDTHT